MTADLTFVGIQPCRIADTRGNGFTGQAGTPSLVAGAPRTFAITGTVAGVVNQCGIPDNAVAVAGNFIVVNAAGTGNLRSWPSGGAFPTVAAVNFSAGQIVGNGSTVPLGPAGLNVQANGAGGDFVLDLTGYYVPRAVSITISDGPGSTTATTPATVASLYSSDLRNQGHRKGRLIARWQNNQQVPACSGNATVQLVDTAGNCSATTGGTVLTSLTHSCGFKAWLDYGPLFDLPAGPLCLDVRVGVDAGTGAWRAFELELVK